MMTFEAAIALFGKRFHMIQPYVKTKSTKEIVEFYYVWKKSHRYQQWKDAYVEGVFLFVFVFLFSFLGTESQFNNAYHSEMNNGELSFLLPHRSMHACLYLHPSLFYSIEVRQPTHQENGARQERGK